MTDSTQRPEPTVALVVATVDLLHAADDDAVLAEQLGCRIPDGWPEFPEAIPFTAALLAEQPDQAPWWMYFFVDEELGALVGSGGYKGPPTDGIVEIGYEVAPTFRGQGYATSAARRLIDQARQSGEVRTVTAHTLAEPNASTRVLDRLGFTRTGTIDDPDVGPVWSWALDLA